MSISQIINGITVKIEPSDLQSPNYAGVYNVSLDNVESSQPVISQILRELKATKANFIRKKTGFINREGYKFNDGGEFVLSPDDTEGKWRATFYSDYGDLEALDMALKQVRKLHQDKKNLLGIDRRNTYNGIINAADAGEQQLKALFDEADKLGEPITKEDLLHCDDFNEAAIHFGEVTQHFPFIAKRLKQSTGEVFTVEELGVQRFGDGTEDHEEMTVLESAGEDQTDPDDNIQYLTNIFTPEIWVGREDDVIQLHAKIPEQYKSLVDLDGVLKGIKKVERDEKITSIPEVAIDGSLTKSALFKKNNEGLSAFDNPKNLKSILQINMQLLANKENPITLDELTIHQICTGDSVLYTLIGHQQLGDVLELAACSGTPIAIEQLTGKFNNGSNESQSAMDLVIDSGQLGQLFPVPDPAIPKTQLWVNRPNEMKKLWNLVPKEVKVQVKEPDFDTRMTYTNAASLNSRISNSNFIEL